MSSRTAEDHSIRPSRLGQAVPWVVLVLGALLSVWGWYLARGYERSAGEARLVSQVRERSAALRAATKNISFAMDDLRLLLDSAGVVDRTSFERYAGPLLQRDQGIIAISWNPRVLDSERDVFESLSQAAVGEVFQITERQRPDSESMIRALKRDQYFPVLWIVPQADFKNALGFDLLSGAKREAALNRSAETRALAVSAPIPLEEEGEFGVLVFVPRFQTTSDGNDQLSGVVVCVIRVQDLLNTALGAFEDKPLGFEIWDVTHPAATQSIATQHVSTSPAGSTVGARGEPAHRELIEWGGRNWDARSSLIQGNAAGQSSVGLSAGLFAGLLLSAVLSHYLFALNRHRRQAEELVRSRTSQLAATNETLEAEAVQRLAVQEELTEHQAQLEERVAERTSELVSTNTALMTEIELRAEAEKALSEGNVRLRLRLEAVSEAVGDWDLENDRSFLSDQTVEVLGFNSQEITDHAERLRIWQASLHPDDYSARTKALTECVKGATDRFEVLVRRHTRTGERRWFEELGKVVSRDANGRARRLVATARDVTSRKLAEQEKQALDQRMREAQKMESLGILSGGIAHDFNNLLAGIIGNVELALEEPQSSPDLTLFLKEIRLGGTRAAELVHQMLAYTGKAPLKVQQVDLAEVVREMLTLLRASVSKKSEFIIETDTAFIEGDPVQIRQVVMNLITNASEALPDGAGEIVITTGNASVDAGRLAEARVDAGLAPGTYPFLEVRDLGVGMDETVLARMFEPFFTTKFSGRGLGLAATLGIVRGHSGALFIDSAPDQGTCVRVIFPPASAGVSVTEPPPSTPKRLSAQTVLVVDDEPQLRKLIKSVLEAQGLTVLIGTDGLHGLEILTESDHNIALVILDATMPVMDGAQFLSAMGDFSDVPVIFTSGHTESALREHSPVSQISGFLPKPFSVEDLVLLVGQVLSAEQERHL